jgi:hypothetical protein
MVDRLSLALVIASEAKPSIYAARRTTNGLFRFARNDDLTM